MSKQYAVAWAKPASSDLESIAAQIAIDDVDAALAFLDRLEARAASLRSMPNRARIVPELLAIDVSRYRELIEGPYRIIFRVESRRVLVVAVLDGRRDLESVLLTRLLQL